MASFQKNHSLQGSPVYAGQIALPIQGSPRASFQKTHSLQGSPV